MIAKAEGEYKRATVRLLTLMRRAGEIPFGWTANPSGRTQASLPTRNKHVDNHDIWVDPKNNDHYLVGCDGGLYESFDRAAT